MAWQTVFDIGSATVSSGGPSAVTWRQYIPAALLTDVTSTKIRITFHKYSSSWSVAEMWVGHVGTDNFDMDGSQVQVTVGGVAGFTVSGDTVSDELTVSFDGTKGLVLSWYQSGSTIVARTTQTGATIYYKSGNVAATADISGATSSGSNILYLVKTIEVYVAGDDDTTGDIAVDLPALSLAAQTGATGDLTLPKTTVDIRPGIICSWTLPKLVKNSVSAALNLPSLTFTVVATVQLNQATGALVLPAFTLVGQEERILFPVLGVVATASQRMPVTVGLTFPSFTLSAKTAIGSNAALNIKAFTIQVRTGQRIGGRMTAFTLEATGTPGILIHSSASTRFKPLQVQGFAGARSEASRIAKFTLTASAVQGNVGSLDGYLKTPRLTLSASAKQGVIGTLSKNLFRLTISATAHREAKGTALTTLTGLRASATALCGSVVTFDQEVALFSLAATGFQNLTGEVDVDLPAFVIAAAGKRTNRFDNLILSYQGR